MKLIVNKILLKGTTNSSSTTILKDVRDNEKAWPTATLLKSSTIKIILLLFSITCMSKIYPFVTWGAYQWSLQNIKTKWIDFFYQNQQTWLFGPTEGKLFFSREVHYVEGWKWKKPEHYLNLPYVVEVQ